MPFPLAHPAAILPFRRFCPRYLNIPALVIGSVIPDSGYLLRTYKIDEFAHGWMGLFGYCLPMGFLVLWIGLRVRKWAELHIPYPYHKLVQLSGNPPTKEPLKLAASLIIGAALHLLLDSLTHRNGWTVQHIAFLYQPIYVQGYRSFRVCHLLWHSVTFVGVFWLSLVFQQWMLRIFQWNQRMPPLHFYTNSFLLSSLVSVIALFHHTHHGFWAEVLVAGFSFVTLIGYIFWIKTRLVHSQ